MLRYTDIIDPCTMEVASHEINNVKCLNNLVLIS